MNLLALRSPLAGSGLRFASSLARLPEVHNKKWKEDVVYLYQFPKAKVVPNLSPFCLKVHTYMKAHKIPHEVVSTWTMRSAKGLLPFIELNGHQHADSQLILFLLQKNFNIKESLTPEQSCVARAVDRMIEGSTFYTILYPKSVENAEKYLHRDVTGLPLPGFVTSILAKSFVKKVKRRFGGVGYGRFSKEELKDTLRRDLQAIDGLLGDKKFLFGDTPAIPDFTLFGHLATSYYLPYRQPVGDFLDDDFPRILHHMSRMRAYYWPEWKDPKMMEDLKGRWDKRIKLAVCTVNNWVLDFQGNYERIIKTCRDAHEQGASVRLGPELEIPGYGCSDHFMEFDTEMHSWEILAKIVQDSKEMKDLLIITGMPVRLKCCLYNCMISIINGKIIFIRPKLTLCDDDIYRETRYFVPWTQRKRIIDFKLPEHLGLDQTVVPFGDGVIISGDHVKIGFEICEELWTANSPNVDLALSGVDIICNGSGSHHILGKSHRRINELVLGASAKLGVTYLYANHRGCDGDRLYYDGMSTIAQNGKIYAQIGQFDIEETAVAVSTLDLNDSLIYRSRSSSTTKESARNEDFLEIPFEDHLFPKSLSLNVPKSVPLVDHKILSPIEELCHGPPTWLWHYLRRSGMSGFFVPLSGGQDSAAVVVMVRLMCDKVVEAVQNNTGSDDPAYYFLGEKVTCSARDLCAKVLFTCYMGTENSSEFTKSLAKGLADDIGSTHSSVIMDSAVNAFLGICKMAYNFIPSFSSSDTREHMALQNVQARIRMVAAYLFAQVGLIYQGRPGGLLVLGTANVDESLVGYVTKYDCSSADINPIGSVSKSDLRKFLALVNERSSFSHLKGIYDSVPTAELRPLVNGEVAQTDEDEIGLTYEEMSQIGRLRRPGCKGPFAMFLALVPLWRPKMSHEEIANKVILFFRRYARNRHKATVATPAYHATAYSNDDHRNDHRPFLYPDFEYQFTKIRDLAKELAEDDATNSK